MLKPNEPLAVVLEQLQQWRHTKEYSNSAVPESLRRQIVHLMNDYSIADIGEVLHLSKSALFRWRKEYSVKEATHIATPTQTLNDTADFIVLPGDSPEPSDSQTLEVNVGDHCKIRLSGHISTAQLDVFTRNIFMYQHGGAA